MCGFSDAISNFNLHILNSSTCNINYLPEIRLTFQLKSKEKDLLALIKSYLGGNFSYDLNSENYSYKTETFDSAYKIINYLSLYLNYWN